MSEPAERLGDGAIGMQIHFFAFHRVPPPFDEDFVAPAADTVRAEAYLGGVRCSEEFGNRVVRALMGVKNLNAAETGQRLPQGVDAAVRCARIGEPLGEDFLGGSVDGGREGHKAISYRDINHVSSRDLVQSMDGQTAQQAREEGMRGMRPTGDAPSLNRLDSHVAYQRHYLISSDLPALAREQIAQHRGASEWQLEVQIIDHARCPQIQIRCGYGSVVHACAKQLHKQGLPVGQQPMRAINQRVPIGPSCLPSGALKRSSSNACWPIFTCSSFRFRPSRRGRCPEESEISAQANSWDSRCVIWFRYPSKRSVTPDEPSLTLRPQGPWLP